jgi:3-hydroxy-9,10-secoandrosta-1,3,5(10)-triene-9,17-dione monooxygenase
MAGNGPGIALNTGSIYHVPFAQIFAYGLSTTAVGALRGMLNLFLKHGGARVAVQGAKTSEDPVAQLLCAETVCALDEIELTRRRNFDAMMADSLAGRLSRLEERRHYKFQAAYSVERCTLLGARIFKASGASAIFDRLPFARILADMQAGRQHVACQWESIGRNWGAHMLGGTTRPDGMV